jgi:hypothetical protein
MQGLWHDGCKALARAQARYDSRDCGSEVAMSSESQKQRAHLGCGNMALVAIYDTQLVAPASVAPSPPIQTCMLTANSCPHLIHRLPAHREGVVSPTCAYIIKIHTRGAAGYNSHCGRHSRDDTACPGYGDASLRQGGGWVNAIRVPS